MSLEREVCSLEYAKRLKELMVNQDSIFKWIKCDHPTEKTNEPHVTYSPQENYDNTPVHDKWTLTSWAAFTVAELGEMLPMGIHSIKYPKDIPHAGGKYECISGEERFKKLLENIELLEDTEADARAKMLIYLIENKLIEV